MATKRKDASKYLGGMAGKAAGHLRSRQSQIDAAVSGATGTPARKAAPKSKKKK